MALKKIIIGYLMTCRVQPNGEQATQVFGEIPMFPSKIIYIHILQKADPNREKYLYLIDDHQGQKSNQY